MIGQNNMILNLKDMRDKPIDEIINLYRQGYRVGCTIEGLNPASCPQSGQKIQGTTDTITLAVTTATVAPYTPIWSVDGVEQTINATWDDANSQFTFPWTFNEEGSADPGTPHTYAGSIKDSCAAGAKTSEADSCTVNIVTAAPVAQAGAGTAAIVLVGGISLAVLAAAMVK